MKKVIGTMVPLSALWTKTDIVHKPTIAAGRKFLRWLSETGQSGWQILPLHQTHLGRDGRHVASPYKGYGVGIDPAYLSQSARLRTPSCRELESFRRTHKDWLPEYALFCVLRDFFHTDDWTQWPAKLRDRNPRELSAWRKKLSKEVHAHAVEQWRLHMDFAGLQVQAKKRKIELIGDLSIYLPLQSPLAWIYKNYFDISKDYTLRRVSGTFNKGFKAYYGRQVWGHPLYDWRHPVSLRMLKKLWQIRVDYLSRLYDVIRLDYAKGLYYYWALDTKNRRRDKVLKGPGTAMFKYIVSLCQQNGSSVFCEDLGGSYLTGLRRDMKRLDIGGMNIMRFVYNEKLRTVSSRYANVANYPVRSVAYTSTHDSETLLGYLQALKDDECKIVCQAVGLRFHKSRKILAKRLRAVILKAPAERIIIPLQDWLLTTERINTPGTEKAVGDKNWRYKIRVPVEKLSTQIGFS